MTTSYDEPPNRAASSERRAMIADWDWQRHARCRSLGTDTFFAPDGESAATRRRREHDAKLICHDCRVRTICRTWAIRYGEPHGIWGGTTEQERRRHAPRRRPNESDDAGNRPAT
ncbi:MAG TPA: WhiB family transcriptional regulator [Aldersonia sp.]